MYKKILLKGRYQDHYGLFNYLGTSPIYLINKNTLNYPRFYSLKRLRPIRHTFHFLKDVSYLVCKLATIPMDPKIRLSADEDYLLHVTITTNRNNQAALQIPSNPKFSLKKNEH